MAPRSRAVYNSPAAINTGLPPARSSTLPPSPGIRIRSPFRSATLVICLLNQPPICMLVLPMGMATRLKGSYNSFHNSSPPPCRSHVSMPFLPMPNGTVEKNWAAGILPAQ